MTSFWLAAEPIENSDEGDVIVYLSEQWWTPWLFFAFCLVIGVWMIRSIVHHWGREQQIRSAAKQSGMEYREQDGFGLSKASFHHMASGDGRGWTAGHVVTMTAKDGAKVHAFDVRSWTEFAVNTNDNGDRTVKRVRAGKGRPGDHISRKHQGSTRSAAMAPLPFHSPRLVISRERLVSKAFVAATRIDLDVESEFFNRNYHVIGDDRRFARDLLDAQMIDYMVSTEGKITFEFLGGWMLLHTEQIEPALVPGLARLADEMRRAIPPLVLTKWGSGGRISDETVTDDRWAAR